MPFGRSGYSQLSDRYGTGELWSINTDGTGQPEQILATPARLDSFSAIDGKLIYLEGPVGNSRMKTLSFRDGAWISSPLIDSQSNTFAGVVSPDGRWIAYGNFESGSLEVYVRP